MFQFVRPVTHGTTAVAELKHGDDGLLGGLVEVTHGTTAVAELKLPHLLLDRAGHLVTHGTTAVAELKRQEDAWSVPQPFGHPRHHCRGRIEAAR